MKQYTLSFSHTSKGIEVYQFVPISIGQAKTGTIVLDSVPAEVGALALPVYKSDRKAYYLHDGSRNFTELTEKEYREYASRTAK